MTLQPDNYAALLGVAILFQNANKPQEAVTRLTLLIDQYPDKAELYSIRAEIEAENKQSELALMDLDKAIEVYRRDKTPPKLIPSGGKGSDESLSEAEANPDRWRTETVEFGKRLLFEAKNESDAEFSFVFSKETGLLEGAAFYGQDAGVNEGEELSEVLGKRSPIHRCGR